MKSSSRIWHRELDCRISWVSQDITLCLPPPTMPLTVWAATCWRDFRATRRSSKVTQTFILERSVSVTECPKDHSRPFKTLQRRLGVYISCSKVEPYLYFRMKVQGKKSSGSPGGIYARHTVTRFFSSFFFSCSTSCNLKQMKPQWIGAYTHLANCSTKLCQTVIKVGL